MRGEIVDNRILFFTFKRTMSPMFSFITGDEGEIIDLYEIEVFSVNIPSMLVSKHKKCCSASLIDT